MQNYRPFAGITTAVKMLIIINVVMYLLAMFIDKRWGFDTANILGLHLPQSVYWKPWQYVTHMFMHGSISHLFFNMFALFMFGRILESVWGSNRFLVYYFVCGLGAAALNSAVGWFEINNLQNQLEAFRNTPEPGLLADFIRSQLGQQTAGWVWELVDAWTNNPDSTQYVQEGEKVFRQIIELKTNIPTIGASGAVFGILLAFGMLFPNTELYLMFIPVPIKAKYFVIGYGLLEFFLGIQNSVGDNVAHFAHLGGMLFGFVLIKYWNRKKKTFY